VTATPAPTPSSPAPNLVEVDHLKVHFPILSGIFQTESGRVRAVDDISFEIRKGETFGLVGESGCGKSTTGRAVIRLRNPTDGTVRFDGKDLMDLSRNDLRKMRRRMQIIFQDPYSSLNPRMTVGTIISEPLETHNLGSKKTRVDRVRELLALVGLNPLYTNRYPHEFSGGQRQRIGVARALAVEPEFIVCDEPISALDVSIQAQVLNLLDDLRRRLGLAYLFIAHNLAVVQHVSDRVAVMYLGRIAELAAREALFAAPLHPYTRALVDAVPVPDPRVERARARAPIRGEAGSPDTDTPGCWFRPRCPVAIGRCERETPLLREHRPGHFAACHRAEEGPP
jgi:oligopeptide transport system ATP-binding protein